MSKVEYISRKDLFKLHHIKPNIRLISIFVDDIGDIDIWSSSHSYYYHSFPDSMKWAPSNILYYSYVAVAKIGSDTYSIQKSRNKKFEINLDLLSDEQLVSLIKESESDLDTILLMSKEYNFLIDIKSFLQKTLADWCHNNRGRIAGTKYGL